MIFGHLHNGLSSRVSHFFALNWDWIIRERIKRVQTQKDFFKRIAKGWREFARKDNPVSLPSRPNSRHEFQSITQHRVTEFIRVVLYASSLAIVVEIKDAIATTLPKFYSFTSDWKADKKRMFPHCVNASLALYIEKKVVILIKHVFNWNV